MNRPTSAGNGSDVMALLSAECVDEDFAADVRAARDSVVAEDPVTER